METMFIEGIGEVAVYAAEPISLTMVLVAMAVSAVMAGLASGLSFLLAPKPDIEDQEPSGLGDYNFPTNLESRYVPVIWGTSKVKGQNVIWYGDFSARELDTADQVVGYEYSLGMDLALCWGPIDAITEITIDEDYALKAGEKYALWDTTTGIAPTAPLDGYALPVSGERLIEFRDTQFFGGTKRGGRLIGGLRFYFGTETQTANSYIAGVERENTLDIDGTSISKGLLVPRYAGLCHAVWEGGVLSDHAVIKSWSFTVHRYPTSLTPSYSKVGTDANGIADANPAHVIFEILTDTNWGLGVPEENIDRDGFIAVAKKCFDEQNGFSFTMDSAKAAKTVIDDILAQVNGVLVQDSDGKFSLRLLRRTYRTSDNAELDYDGVVTGNTILTVGPSDIIKMVSASRQAWSETFNVVQVHYNDRNDEFKEAVATAHDLANMSIQNGLRRVKQIKSKGVRTAQAAAVVAQRNLVTVAYPITSAAFEVSREFSSLRPGDIIEVNHPDFGLESFYMRIFEVGLPKDTDGNILLKGMRDVFDEPAFDEVMHTGGDTTSLSLIGSVRAEEATSVELTGLPYFFHSREGLDPSEFHTWHIVAAPTPTSRAGQPHVEDPAAPGSGVWNAVGAVKTLCPSGTVVAHPSDIWQDRSFARRYINDSIATANNLGGPYSRIPGPVTNPIMHNSNIEKAAKNTMNEGFTQGLMTTYSLRTNKSLRTDGCLWVTGLDDPEALVSTFTDDQLRYYGFGMALVRPAWADGDERFTEIISYKVARTMTVEVIDYYDRSISARAQEVIFDGVYNQKYWSDVQTLESYKVLVLDQVYRGCMDTGIQSINSGSEILFIDPSQVMYDADGVLSSDLQSGGAWLSSGDVTYREQVLAVGGVSDLDVSADHTVTASQRYRKEAPSSMAKLTHLPWSGSTWTTPDEFWGRSYYDNGEFQGYYFPRSSETTGGNEARFRMQFEHQNVLGAITPKVWFYDESTVGGVASQGSSVTFHLLEDDTSASATVGKSGWTAEQLRYRNAMARFKEGWLPTNPPLEHGEVGAVDEPFMYTSVQTQNSQGSTTGHTWDLHTIFTTAGATFTTGEKYYVEIWIQMARFDGSNPIEASYGAQRIMYEITAK